MKTISILTFLMISLSTFGQENQTFLKNWKSYPVPTDEDTLSKYNWSPNNWVVYKFNLATKKDEWLLPE